MFLTQGLILSLELFLLDKNYLNDLKAYFNIIYLLSS